MKGRGFSKSIKTKTKQNKTNVTNTIERRHAICKPKWHSLYVVCIFMFSSHSFWTSSSSDVPTGVTQEEGHIGFRHLSSVVLALMFLARRIQPFLSLATVKSNFVYLRFTVIVLHSLGIFSFSS